jgi:flagellar basal-body rod protein FlgF
MQTEVESLRVASQNIANAQTTAYRRQMLVTHLQFDRLLGEASVTAPNAGVMQTQIAVDLQPSTMKSTGEPLDIAMAGPGFMTLQSDAGTLLTRRGDLHLSSDGILVSSTGIPVLGNKGTIQIGAGTAAIGTDGSIKVDGNVIDQLRVVDVSDTTKLVPLGDGSYNADAADVQQTDSDPGIRQGFLETSNVVPVNEMVQLMETVRRFESEQKFALAYDGMLTNAISVLGKVG